VADETALPVPQLGEGLQQPLLIPPEVGPFFELIDVLHILRTLCGEYTP
jgi:hypothetical protein